MGPQTMLDEPLLVEGHAAERSALPLMSSGLSTSSGPKRRGGRARPIRFDGVSARDHRILCRALHLLGGSAPSFVEAVRAVRAAVEELIDAGRVYHLGAGEQGPIVGSLVSGVGITAGAEVGKVGEVVVVRVDRGGRWTVLGSLSR